MIALDSIICDPAAIKFLKGQFLSSKIPHAQLFVGPEGSGNLAAAIGYAQLIMCEMPDRQLSLPCNQCHNCVQNNLLYHQDLHFFYPKLADKDNANSIDKLFREAIKNNPYLNASAWLSQFESGNKQLNISTETVRNVVNSISKKSFESDSQIIIVWLPEYMGEQGNVLLKLIEEPNPGSYVFLVTNQVDKILPTILSRCQQVVFRKIETQRIKEHIISKYNFQDDLANRLALMADGNWHRAMQLAEQDNIDNGLDFVEWTRLCWNPKASVIQHWVEDFSKKSREFQKAFFYFGTIFIGEVLRLKYVSDLQSKLSEEQEAVGRKMAERFSLETIDRIKDLLDMVLHHIEANANTKILLTDAMYSMNNIIINQSSDQDS